MSADDDFEVECEACGNRLMFDDAAQDILNKGTWFESLDFYHHECMARLLARQGKPQCR